MSQVNFSHAINNGIQLLPVHIAAPLYSIYQSNNYFKRLHLISDVLFGCFRLYGHAMIQLAKRENAITSSLEQSIESLTTKDSHGLWSTTIAKLIQEMDKQKSPMVPAELATAFGVNIKSAKQAGIKKMMIRNVVIDSKGHKQQVEVTNTPVEILINFRNKYVGHGTVYSENESSQIFTLYEPVLVAFIEQMCACEDFVFANIDDQSNIHGYNKSSNGRIKFNFKSQEYTIEAQEQLAIENQSETLISNPNSDIKIDADDKKIINTYPYFLAHPYKRALEEEDGFKRLHLLKECFLNYLKYLGLLTASEYFNSELKIGDINRAFKNFLYRPQFGHWNAFMRSAIAALSQNNHKWFVKELPGYYKSVETDPYAEKGETSIGKLIHFRNHYLGHGTVPNATKAKALWDANYALLKELLLSLDFCKNYTIVCSDKTVSWRLMGDEITLVNLRQKLKSNVAMLNEQNEELSLAPFFILPGEYFIKEVSDRAKLMVYEQNTGSRIVFFSPESVHGETNNEKVLDQLNLMIREKERQDPVALKDLDQSAWKALLHEHNEATLQTLWSEQKVIKGVYQERQDAEVALRSWVGARANLFFLSAEAGSGKTNLLVEMNRQYAERGLDTILLRGNRFRSPDIWEELCYRLNLTPESLFNDAGCLKYEQENPLMILIDGANENSNAKALFDSILEFLEKNKGGHIKIVLSWRVNTKGELPVADEKYESLFYVDDNAIERDSQLVARSCYWLKPLNKVEVEGAWKKYVTDKLDNVRRKPNFTYEELIYHDRSLSDQLDNPLLLRLFLELNNGKGLPKSRGGFISIWSLYHEKLIAQ